MRILSTPPHAAGDGTPGWNGWMEAFSFRFRAVGVGTLRFSDFRILEFSEFRIFTFWNSRSFGFSHFGIFGVSDFQILAFRVSRSGCRWGLGFSEFRILRFWDFRSFGFSDLGILGFSAVGLFGFSGMLDFQMFECFCFGLDDFAKFGKLKKLRALINLLAYLQKVQ